MYLLLLCLMNARNIDVIVRLVGYYFLKVYMQIASLHRLL
jgi:hypothetical protein